MFPKLIILPTYGLLFALAVLIAWWWFLRRARTIGIPEEQAFNLTFYALLGGIIGAKLLLLVVDGRIPGTLAELIALLRSAGVLLGGVVVGALTFAIYAHRHKLPILRLGDAIAAPLALAQSVGRLGCFAAGCCWGKPTHPDHPFAITFTNPVAHAQTGVPLHVPLVATQLLQMVHDLLLAGLLAWLWRRNLKPDGTVLWVYVLIYSLGRGIIEFWRGDVDRGMYFGNTISTSQLLSLAGAILALAMLVRGVMTSRQAASA